MTPEQRAALTQIAVWLDSISTPQDIPYLTNGMLAADASAAADILRTLSAQQAQAEPVAWRYIPSKVWGDYVLTKDAEMVAIARSSGIDVQPLYTAQAAPAVRAPLTELEAAYLAQEAGLRIITREETAALMRLVRFVEAAVSGGITQEHRR